MGLRARALLVDLVILFIHSFIRIFRQRGELCVIDAAGLASFSTVYDAAGSRSARQHPLRHVQPHRLQHRVSPSVRGTRPWGMNNWAVQTNNYGGARASPLTHWWFHPEDREVYGIRCTHQASPWIYDYGEHAAAHAVGWTSARRLARQGECLNYN